MSISKIKFGNTTESIKDANAYVKPSGGIPKTDLASAVQTSLGKADSALQAVMVETTWAALKALRDNSQLVPGRQYRITDYTTTTTQADTQAAGHQFDLIVIADAPNKLNENARAALHSGDTYFSTAGAKLEAWELKYALDNDNTEYEWADSTNGKGVIYWMKDEWNNECPYDFKNILFKRYDVSEFTLIDGQYYNNYSAQKKDWFNSISGTLPYRFYNGYSTPVSGQDAVDEGYADLLDVDEEEILESGLSYCVIDDPSWDSDPGLIASFNESSISVGWFYTFTKRINNSNSDKSLTEVCYNNVFKGKASTLKNNVFISTNDSSCIFNTFGNSCHSNTFGNQCHSNTFGNNCSSNTFGNQCSSNTFGNECYINTFGNQCFSITFGVSCSYITFGNYGQSNTFGNQCSSNTFGNSCLSNTFGNHCSSNTFGNDCYSNIFGDNCSSNTFGNECQSNTFGNNCSFIYFGNGPQTLTKSYYRYIIIENGNQCIRLNCSATTSSSAYYQNVKIAQGVNNAATWKTITDANVRQTFQTVYQPNNSQIISV